MGEQKETKEKMAQAMEVQGEANNNRRARQAGTLDTAFDWEWTPGVREQDKEVQRQLNDARTCENVRTIVRNNDITELAKHSELLRELEVVKQAAAAAVNLDDDNRWKLGCMTRGGVRVADEGFVSWDHYVTWRRVDLFYILPAKRVLQLIKDHLVSPDSWQKMLGLISEPVYTDFVRLALYGSLPAGSIKMSDSRIRRIVWKWTFKDTSKNPPTQHHRQLALGPFPVSVAMEPDLVSRILEYFGVNGLDLTVQYTAYDGTRYFYCLSDVVFGGAAFSAPRKFITQEMNGSTPRSPLLPPSKSVDGVRDVVLSMHPESIDHIAPYLLHHDPTKERFVEEPEIWRALMRDDGIAQRIRVIRVSAGWVIQHAAMTVFHMISSHRDAELATHFADCVVRRVRERDDGARLTRIYQFETDVAASLLRAIARSPHGERIAHHLNESGLVLRGDLDLSSIVECAANPAVYFALGGTVGTIVDAMPTTVVPSESLTGIVPKWVYDSYWVTSYGRQAVEAWCRVMQILADVDAHALVLLMNKKKVRRSNLTNDLVAAMETALSRNMGFVCPGSLPAVRDFLGTDAYVGVILRFCAPATWEVYQRLLVPMRGSNDPQLIDALTNRLLETRNLSNSASRVFFWIQDVSAVCDSETFAGQLLSLGDQLSNTRDVTVDHHFIKHFLFKVLYDKNDGKLEWSSDGVSREYIVPFVDMGARRREFDRLHRRLCAKIAEFKHRPLGATVTDMDM
jgi:hypothetical protein